MSWTRNAEFEFDKKESEKIDLGVNKTGIKPREKKKKIMQKGSNQSLPRGSVSKIYIVIIMPTVTVKQGWKFRKSAFCMGPGEE